MSVTVRRKHIRSLVERTLENYQITNPPIDVKDLARSFGAEVRYQPGDPELSGFLLRDPAQRCPIIGVNSNHHPNRQRFTVAHELGHLLLHEGEAVHIDRVDRGFQINRRSQQSSQGIDIQEKEANLFAAELLMPVRFLDTDLAELGIVDLLESEGEGSLHRLAQRYQVSPQALTFRLGYLDYIQI